MGQILENRRVAISKLKLTWVVINQKSINWKMHLMYVVKNPHTSSLKYILFFPGMKTFQLENLEKGVILKWLLGLNSDFLPTKSAI